MNKRLFFWATTVMALMACGDDNSSSPNEDAFSSSAYSSSEDFIESSSSENVVSSSSEETHPPTSSENVSSCSSTKASSSSSIASPVEDEDGIVNGTYSYSVPIMGLYNNNTIWYEKAIYDDSCEEDPSGNLVWSPEYLIQAYKISGDTLYRSSNFAPHSNDMEEIIEEYINDPSNYRDEILDIYTFATTKPTTSLFATWNVNPERNYHHITEETITYTKDSIIYSSHIPDGIDFVKTNLTFWQIPTVVLKFDKEMNQQLREWSQNGMTYPVQFGDSLLVTQIDKYTAHFKFKDIEFDYYYRVWHNTDGMHTLYKFMANGKTCANHIIDKHMTKEMCSEEYRDQLSKKSYFYNLTRNVASGDCTEEAFPQFAGLFN